MASANPNKRTGRIEVRAYAGIDPVTHKPRNLSESLPGDSPVEYVEEVKRKLEKRAAFCKGSGYSFTVGGGLRYYLDSLMAIGRSPTTIDSYESKYRCYVEPFIADVPLDAALPYVFTSLYNRLLAEGGKDGNPVSRNTVRQFHAFLSGAFKWMCDVPLVDHNPMDGVTQPAEEFNEAIPLCERDFEVLMDYLDTHDDPFANAVWLFLHSGARRGEIAAMR
ncbi:MAG: hypothetical protein RRZ85_09660, partial [Gordonibacter sp.]|uniref:site-specific integrase n=1 Tax=Gordonibacter sp. TaxID=1968902 RepID=UPI002FC6D547